MSDEKYDEDYFLRGKETGKSLYENYRWLPELTIPMAGAIVRHLGIVLSDTVLDFGCARGYTVRALRSLGFDAWGHDISKWAVENADESVREFVTTAEPIPNSFDWVIAKDVLEHVVELTYTVDWLHHVARKGIFVVVPLAHGKRYDILSYEEDVTHVYRHPLSWWVGQFFRPGWSVEGRYRVPGVKDNYSQYPTGNGFITARRL